MRGTTGFDAAGRWSLLPAVPAGDREAVEHAAMTLLRRYGVVCRKVLARETLAPSWRELLPIYRSAEARGEIRGGRFVEPLGGEQFALLEAVEELRRLRRQRDADEWVALSAADPLNLAGWLDGPGRVCVSASRRVVYKNGSAVAAETAAGCEWLVSLTPAEQRHAAGLLAPADSGKSLRRPGVWRIV